MSRILTPPSLIVLLKLFFIFLFCALSLDAHIFDDSLQSIPKTFADQAKVDALFAPFVEDTVIDSLQFVYAQNAIHRTQRIVFRNSFILIVLFAFLVLQLSFRQSRYKSKIYVSLGDKDNQISERNHDIQAELVHIKQREGIVPICWCCKKIRNHKGCWSEVEAYYLAFSDAILSHGICPDCFEKLYAEVVNEE